MTMLLMAVLVAGLLGSGLLVPALLRRWRAARLRSELSLFDYVTSALKADPSAIPIRHLGRGCGHLRRRRFDPFAEIHVGTKHDVQDAFWTATTIVDHDGSGFDGEFGFWKRRSRELLTGLLLHVLYSPQYPEKSLRSITDFLTDTTRSLKDRFAEMSSTIHDLEGVFGWTDFRGIAGRTHPFVAWAAREQLDRPECEASSIKSQLLYHLNRYRDDELGANWG